MAKIYARTEGARGFSVYWPTQIGSKKQNYFKSVENSIKRLTLLKKC